MTEEDRKARRKSKKRYEDQKKHRENNGQKPHKLLIKEDGSIDASCDGKPAWDETVRSLIDRFLDVSIVSYDKQKKEALEIVRERLDKDFEYEPCTLSTRTFRRTITNSLKSERFRLKKAWKNGDSCPAAIQPDQWEKLVLYWDKKTTREKANAMINARGEVKQLGAVGRRGKDRAKALEV